MLFKTISKPLINIILFCTCAFFVLILFSWENKIGTIKSPKHIRLKGLYPEPTRLLNIENFQYLINNEVCNEYPIKGIIIVTSYAGDPQGRSAHRRALSNEQLWDIHFKRIFLLAKIPLTDKYAITENALKNENERFGDIVQGNFQEAYRNLTYKHIMGLKWATDYCSKAEYVIKMDDDIIMDIYALLTILNKKYYQENLLMGYVIKNMAPIREPANKWFVKYNEYPLSKYPTFLSGWLYITNPQTAKRLIEESQKVPYFWIDDTYVTGMLAERLHIQHINLNKYYTVHPENIECCIRDWKNHKFKCDYIVCTNGNDFNLFVRYSKMSFDCSKLNNCLHRPNDKKIKDTCVAQRRMNLESRGNPIIKAIKL